ncbi:MAG: hypothetical protein MJE77_37855, partial [Proteobacteria bacterium]|nr:hypothetical protein [Pseudomonadota bacterium]
ELIDFGARLLPGIRTDRVRMFGFSGGGQFVHRYAMLHPARVERAVVGAAGWYTFPDPGLPYPLGIDSGTLPADLGFDREGFASNPLLVLVGDRDIDAGAFRRRLWRDWVDYDLDELQGRGRLQRARRWVAAVREQLPNANIVMQEVPDTGHRISEAMRAGAARFLAE